MPGQMFYSKQGGPLVPINPGPIGPKGDPGEQGPQGDGKPPHIGADEPTDPQVVEWFDTDDPGQPYVTRVTHPNQSDTLVEAWDGNVWVMVSYDSGWRNINGEIGTPSNWTGVNAKMRRVGNFVEFMMAGNVAAGATFIGSVSTGTLFNTTAWGPGWQLWGIQFVEYGSLGQVGQQHLSTVTGSGYNIAMSTSIPIQGGASVRIRMRYPLQSEVIPTSLPGTPVAEVLPS